MAAPSSLTHLTCRLLQGNLAPAVPKMDQGYALLSFSTFDVSQGEEIYVGGNFDVNLINNVFIDNDYSFENDGAVSSFLTPLML